MMKTLFSLVILMCLFLAANSQELIVHHFNANREEIKTDTLFLEICQEGRQQQGMSDVDAKKYCDCALTEVRVLIPNPHHVISLTEEELTHIFNKCQQ